MPRRTKRAGRPPVLLDHDVRTRLLDHVKDGNHVKTACALVGIHPATVYRWVERAEEADELLLAGEPIDEVQRVYCDFRDALFLARAHAQKTAVKVVQRAMHGGEVVSEEPLLGLDGQPLRNDDGEILYRRAYTAPDGRLAMTFLARTAPDQWGPSAQQVEVTGANGGPVQVDVERITSLAERIAAVVAERKADAEADAREALELEEGIQDAEVVDE